MQKMSYAMFLCIRVGTICTLVLASYYLVTFLSLPSALNKSMTYCARNQNLTSKEIIPMKKRYDLRVNKQFERTESYDMKVGLCVQ